MQKLKVLIKKDDKPLQQISKRLQEIHKHGIKCQYTQNSKVEQSFKNEHFKGPIMKRCTLQFALLKLNRMMFDINSKANNCCELTSGQIIIICNFCYNDKYKNRVIIGREFLRKIPLYTSPCSSTNIGIYEV